MTGPQQAGQRRMRVVVTRPAGQADELIEELRRLDCDVSHVPLISIQPTSDDPIDVTPYDWVVLTSSNGARELRRRMRGEPRQVAVIGEATGRAFGRADLVASTSTQEGLLEALPSDPGRVLFAGANDARSLLAETLSADVVVLYTTELVTPAALDGDLVVLASPSAARALAATGSRIPAVSIGPETTREAVALGIKIAGEASTHDAPGLVAAVARVLAQP